MKKIFVIFFIFTSIIFAKDYLVPLDILRENPKRIRGIVLEIENDKNSKYYSQEIARQDLRLTILLSKKYNINVSNKQKMKEKFSESLTREESLNLMIKNIDENEEYLNVTQYLKDLYKLILKKEGFDE